MFAQVEWHAGVGRHSCLNLDIIIGLLTAPSGVEVTRVDELLGEGSESIAVEYVGGFFAIPGLKSRVLRMYLCVMPNSALPTRPVETRQSEAGARKKLKNLDSDMLIEPTRHMGPWALTKSSPAAPTIRLHSAWSPLKNRYDVRLDSVSPT
jgi:hypothetical protein